MNEDSIQSGDSAAASAEVSCAEMLKVLADEKRLAIVDQLLDGPKHVGEINERLQVEQSLLSHHLKVLRESGLVVAQRDGKAVLYRLAPHVEAMREGRSIHLGCCTLVFEQKIASDDLGIHE